MWRLVRTYALPNPMSLHNLNALALHVTAILWMSSSLLMYRLQLAHQMKTSSLINRATAELRRRLSSSVHNTVGSLKVMYFLCVFCLSSRNEFISFSLVSLEPHSALHFLGLYGGCVLISNLSCFDPMTTFNFPSNHVSCPMLVCLMPCCFCYYYTQCEYE